MTSKFLYELGSLATPELLGINYGLNDSVNNPIPDDESLFKQMLQSGLLGQYKKYIANKNKISKFQSKKEELQNQELQKDELHQPKTTGFQEAVGYANKGRRPDRKEEQKSGGQYEQQQEQQQEIMIPDDDYPNRQRQQEILIPADVQPHEIQEDLEQLDHTSLTILYAGLRSIYNKFGKSIDLTNGSLQMKPLTEMEKQKLEETEQGGEKPMNTCRRMVYIGKGRQIKSFIVCENGYYKKE